MSLKRKATSVGNTSLQKKVKADFFAPRPQKFASQDKNAFTFKPLAVGTTRLITWNVNGIKSVDEKVLERYLKAEDPSLMILTETRCSEGKPDIFCLKTRFKYQYWGAGPQHAGTAILSKAQPLKATIGLPTWKNSATKTEGRYIELEFEDLYVVGTYVPNSGDNFQAMDLRREWNAAFKSHLRTLDSNKPVIWAGDFNCILTKKDVDSTAQTYWDKMGGMSPEERSDFDELLNAKADEHPRFIDAWRHLHPLEEEYTHASKKFGSWRLDSFIMSSRILDKAVSCEIRNVLKDLKLSDHWPVAVDIAALI